MTELTSKPNRLIHSSSPYLLQHAHNPIDWYPWGDEAFEQARLQDKPIFVSIGYSTCYWCHVMERDIFCNPEMGALMNSGFINIKVDREERPDIDDIYMAARQLITRQGGWPNNVALTPDLKPFWAAGTLAADNRYGPSFPEIALWLIDSWQNNRDKITQSAEEITNYLKLQLTEARPPSDIGPDVNIAEKLVEKLTEYADREHGGFFKAPKFPHETYLLFLLDYYRATKSKEALTLVTTTLNNIAAGGIHDHVGGGFHRYAVDGEWKVPHFEKMLYNQALLGRCFTEAFDATNDAYYRNVAESAYDFVISTFTGPDGQFYSALDAETDAVEGAYYAWTPANIHIVLFHEEVEAFFDSFELTEIPHITGHKHPEGGVITARSPVVLRSSSSMRKRGLQKLKKARDKRPMPLLDTKIITAWHAMMMDSFAVAGKLLGRNNYIKIAEAAAGFIERDLLRKDGRLLRIAVHGETSEIINGFLEDYAHSIQGLLSLYDATAMKHYLALAQRLTRTAIQLFEDSEHGGFFFTEQSDEQLLRIKTADDNALPSANAIMLQNLVRLAHITHESVWAEKAEQMLLPFNAEMKNSPVAYASMVHGFQQLITLLGQFPDLTKSITEAATPWTRHANAQIITKPETIRQGEVFSVTIRITIEKGWHLTPETTTITFAPSTIRLHSLHMPVTEHYVGEVLVTAKLSIDAALPSGDETMTALVGWQPCNDNSCDLPAKIALDFTVTTS